MGLLFQDKTKLVLIAVGLYLSLAYGTENAIASFCVNNETTGCGTFFIQCKNDTFYSLNVYFSDVICNGTARFWCQDVITHVDVLDTSLSATYQQRFRNKTSINVTSLQELKTGRYVFEYTCGDSYLVYGTENGIASFCVNNETTGCGTFFIQCKNDTFYSLNVYSFDAICNGTARLWCNDVITPVDVLDTSLSAIYQQRFKNKTSINVTSLQELTTGRYVFEYTCGVPLLEEPGDTIALIVSLTFVGLVVVLAIPLAIYLRNRKTGSKPESLSQDNPMYIPYNDDDPMATTSQANVHDQDGHVYDHTYVSSIDNRSDKAVEMNYEHVHYKNVTELNKGQWDNKTETSEDMGGDYVYSQVKK